MLNLTVVTILLVFRGHSVSCQELESIPELTITDWIQGKPDLDGHWGDGKIYVVDIWGTWCSPCIKNIPELNQIQKEFASDDLIVIGYSWEAPDQIRSFLKERVIEYTLVSDTSEKFMNILSDQGVLQGFPYAYLVGRDGKVMWHGNPKEGLAEAVKTLVRD